MRNKLDFFFKARKRAGKVDTLESPYIYIVDKKKEQHGDIEISDMEDKTIKGVILTNEPPLKICYYVFAENCLRQEKYDNKGKLIFAKDDKYRQCECVLFPSDMQEETKHWILLVETKYANNYDAASNKEYNYPQGMIEQIIQTSEYLRRHNIVPPKRKIHAIVSFPNIIQNFNASLFQGDIFTEDECKIDVNKAPSNAKLDRTQIAHKYKVIIQAQNHATIKTIKKLHFD